MWDLGDEVWDGEYEDSDYPLDFFTPDPLNWVLDCDEDEEPTLALLDAVKEDFIREVKVVRPKQEGAVEFRKFR